MQLLNVMSARSTWLFDLNDLNPRGKSLFSDLIDWLKTNYAFQKVPSSTSDHLSFKEGRFKGREEAFVAIDLTVYTDGLIANTSSSTADTDRFLEHVLITAATHFNLVYHSEMIRSKLYLSELTVHLDHPLANLDPKLSAFATKISSVGGKYIGAPFEAGGISFWTDLAHAAVKHPPFSIERRLNAPFSENRFFCRAPFQTEDHIALLNDFEQLLTAVQRYPK